MKPVVEDFEMGETQIQVTKCSMSNSQALDAFSEKYNLEKIPDCVFGHNKILIKTPLYQILFSAENALQYLNQNFLKEKAQSQKLDIPGFLFENDVKVKIKEKWDQMHSQNGQPIEVQQLNQDWTHINHYQGEISTDRQITVSKDDVSIPKERLSPDNKIHFYQDLYFHEDDLGDFGYSRLRVRMRVQKDSIFVLMNSYIRVDSTIIRAKETRYFIDFLDSYSIIRQLDCYESKWEDILKKGFKFDSSFNIDLDQAEKVTPFLNKLHSHSEQIMFN